MITISEVWPRENTVLMLVEIDSVISVKKAASVEMRRVFVRPVNGHYVLIVWRCTK